MAGLDYIKAPGFPPDNVYYVALNYHESKLDHKFNNIQRALDHVIDHITTSGYTGNSQIIVSPGIYTEHIINTHANIYIISQNFDATDQTKDVVIYNTGVDTAHQPFDHTTRINLSGITVRTDTGGVFGKLTPDSEYQYCKFEGGYFIDSDVSAYIDFRFCTFTGDAFKLTGATSGWRFIALRHCDLFGGGLPIFGSDAAGTVKFEYTLLGDNTSISGNWAVLVQQTELYSDGKLTFDTNGNIEIFSSIISNGIYFVTDTTGTKKISNCIFKNTSVGEADITAAVDITDVEYNNNIQDHGISGKIHTVRDVVNVGEDSINRYYSVQDAINSLTSGGVVFVSPGTYTEQIYSKANVTLQGYTTEGVPAKKTTTLYNTGVDAAHYPLRGDDDDYYVINDITIETDVGGVIGKIGAHKFSGCVFSKGHFIEATKNADMLLGLDNCSFLESKAFDLTGVGSGGLRAMTIIGCFFGDHSTHCKFDSTHTSTLAVVKNCIFHKSYPDIGGNWKLEMSDCHILGTSRSIISTTNKITLIKCIISNGLHFTSNPDVIIQLSTFQDDCGYAITGEDITAAVTVTDVSYVQNVQQNGLSGKIQIQDQVKNVGGDAVNRYYTLQDAVTSVPMNGAGFVKIFEDISGLSELTLPTGADVTLDTQNIYNLTFTNDIVEIGANQKCFFQNFVTLNGGEILVNGAAAELKFIGCGVVNGHIVITDGSDVKIRRSGLVADTGYPAVTMNDLTCKFTFGYSKLQGATGQAAIKVTAECDGMIKGKFSTLISGTAASIAPILYTGANKLDIALYNSALSGTISAATMTNTIGSPNLTYDAGIDY